MGLLAGLTFYITTRVLYIHLMPKELPNLYISAQDSVKVRCVS